jgi:hypothetical protein
MAKIHGLLEDYHKLDARYKLYAPTPTERGELAVITDLNAQLKKLKQPIDVKVGTKTFKNIYGANKIAGTPKADIALVTFNKTSGKFENVCFISHKMGTSAKDFQQYSGITTKADGSKSGSISNDPVVLKFLDDLTVVHKDIILKKQRYHRIIKSDGLIGKSVFGPVYGSKTYGEDNIHVNGQGNARSLAKIYDTYVNDLILDKNILLKKSSIKKCLTERISRVDQSLMLPIRWSEVGLILRGGWLFGKNKESFGHNGWGGSLGFADPVLGIGVAYTTNKIKPKMNSDFRIINLIKKFYEIEI